MLWPAPAQAAELVGNPGPVTLTGNAPGGDVAGHTAPLRAVGAVESTGNLLFPMGDFDPIVFEVPVSQGGSFEVHSGELTLSPTEDVTGTIDPAPGSVSLTGDLAGDITVDATYLGIDFTATCDVGTATDPVEITLGTEPLGPGFDSPVPYDQATGTAVLVGTTSVPAIDPDTCEFTGGSFLAQFINFASGQIAGSISDAFDGAPLVVATRFDPPPRAPGYVPPAQDPGPTSTGSPASPGGSGGPLLPSNVFTFGPLRSSATGVGTIVLNLPGPGVVSAVATANVKGGAARRITVARARKSAAAAGRVTLRLKPTRAAKTILRRKGRLRTSVRVTYSPTGGSPRSATRALTFKVKRARR
jgi:hypothetical protein